MGNRETGSEVAKRKEQKNQGLGVRAKQFEEPSSKAGSWAESSQQDEGFEYHFTHATVE
jgi:uncharacterized protein YcaQ